MKPGLIQPEQWNKVAPRRKVTVGILVFALLQVLAHFNAGPDAIGLESWTVEALAMLAAMWLVPEKGDSPRGATRLEGRRNSHAA